MKIFVLVLVFLYTNVHAISGNKKFESFNKSKKELHKIYINLEKKTVYCRATFDGNKITNKNGFRSISNSSRDSRVEWEHIVPASKFGKNFDSWRNGHKECIDNRGDKLGKRDCAQKINKNFRRMQADMYNLYPSIGTVNAMRQDYIFVETLPNARILGRCKMKIKPQKVEPPEYARGIIARAYLYMKEAYPFKMKFTYNEKKLYDKWNKLYPPTLQECKRGRFIAKVQGNSNKVLEKACINKKSSFSESIINSFKNKLDF